MSLVIFIVTEIHYFAGKKIGKNLKKHVCSIYNLFFQQKISISKNHISFYKEKIA